MLAGTGFPGTYYLIQVLICDSASMIVILEGEKTQLGGIVINPVILLLNEKVDTHIRRCDQIFRPWNTENSVGRILRP